MHQIACRTAASLPRSFGDKMHPLKKILLAGFLAVLGFLYPAGKAFASVAPNCDLSDPQCDPYDPPPSTSSFTPAADNFYLAPGAVFCYIPLSASNSAGVGGYISFSGSLVKRPKVTFWWSKDGISAPISISSNKIYWDSVGYFEVVIYPGNGYGAYFPGYFQICLRNPGANYQTILFQYVTPVVY